MDYEVFNNAIFLHNRKIEFHQVKIYYKLALPYNKGKYIIYIDLKV